MYHFCDIFNKFSEFLKECIIHYESASLDGRSIWLHFSVHLQINLLWIPVFKHIDRCLLASVHNVYPHYHSKANNECHSHIILKALYLCLSQRKLYIWLYLFCSSVQHKSRNTWILFVMSTNERNTNFYLGELNMENWWCFVCIIGIT
jgi:hypothetical protein